MVHRQQFELAARRSDTHALIPWVGLAPSFAHAQGPPLTAPPLAAAAAGVQEGEQRAVEEERETYRSLGYRSPPEDPLVLTEALV